MRKRAFLVGFAVLAVLFAAAVSSYWFWWTAQLERGVVQWREQQRVRGYEIGFVGPEFGGFPLAHVARFEDPAVVMPKGGQWRGPSLVARSALWEPRAIDFAVAGRHVLEGLSNRHVDRATVDLSDAHARLRIDSVGRLGGASADVRTFEALTEPLGRFAGERLKLSVSPHYGGSERVARSHAFSLEAGALEFPPALAAPFEPDAEGILAVGRLDGFIPDVEPRRALAVWRDAGGVLHLERVEVDWPPIALSASGRLTLDGEFRPEGELAARIAGLPELLDRLADLGQMTTSQVANTKLALRALSGGQDDQGRPILTVPIILRAGLLSLGPLPLARLSPVL